MTHSVLSEAVRRFLTDAVTSVERLTVLLFMHRHAARWWEAQALATELEMQASTVQSHLEQLSARNLLDVRIATSVFYCYKPGREELSGLMEEVARAHFLHHDAVVAVLAGPSSDSARDGARLFAAAFQFRKGKRDA